MRLRYWVSLLFMMMSCDLLAQQCGAGYYYIENYGCHVCNAGQYAPFDNMTQCFDADPGYYVPLADCGYYWCPGAATAQVPCPRGYYSSSSGAYECAYAYPGSYTTGWDPADRTKATGVAAARPGYYANGKTEYSNLSPVTTWDIGPYWEWWGGATEETPCPAGTASRPYAKDDGYAAVWCQVANPDMYVSDNDLVYPDPGFNLAGGHKVEGRGDGYWFNTRQAPCPPGTYTDNWYYNVFAKCTSTPAGAYAPSPGTSSWNLMDCPAGMTSGAGATFCYVPGSAPTGNYKGSVVKDSAAKE